MKVLTTVIIITVVMIPISILALLLKKDILGAKDWKNAERCKGKVLKVLEKRRVSGYGGGGLFTSYNRYYNQYETEIVINNETYIKTVVMKDEANIGDIIDVRYTWYKGEISIAFPFYRDRLRDFVIGLCIGVPFGLLLIVLKELGII